MPKTVIIAEKPSVAREIAKVLGVRGARRDGYIADQRYAVTWAVGHLVNISEPEEQDKRWSGRWSLGQLPMIPGRFKLSVLPKTEKQFEIVKQLLTSEDTEEIINATDAGREGELIFRRIYLMAGCDKPIKRLWASDMTEEGLKKALSKLMTGEDKRNLGLAAFARAEADWLIGMNFSRLFTVKDGKLISVGRVQTPVLKLLADRRREIEHFVPKDYWTVEGTFAKSGEEGFQAVWHELPELKETRIDREEDARALVDKCTGKEGRVDSVKSRQGSQKPPLPFDLTTLQREANSRFGLSAKDTLSIAQTLYEKKKVLTYPRTDSRHLTREIFKEILGHFRAVYPNFPEITKQAADIVKEGKARFECVNDKKVTDHHAIIPTARKADRAGFTDNEWKIYEMVCRRFVAAFLPKVKYSSSTVWIDVEGEKFKATGKIFRDKGWLVAEPWRAAQDNPLPPLKKGNAVAAEELACIKRQTKAPAHFTDASLLAAMETAGKFVEDEELKDAMKERGLGTPATRAQLIETLLSRGYVEKDKKKLICTDRGLQIVDAISRLLPAVSSPEMTGDWEKKLKDIEQGRFTYPEFMHQIRAFVHESVMQLRDRSLTAPPPPRRPAPRPQQPQQAQPQAAPPQPREREVIGKCPLCGGDVVEGQRGYGCVNYRQSCDFVIWKSFNGGEVNDGHVRDLLTHGRTYKRVKFQSKAGKKYAAHLKLKGKELEVFFKD